MMPQMRGNDMNSSILNYQNMRLFLEGKREGRIDAYVEMCTEGFVDADTAAEKLNFTAEELDKIFKARNHITEEDDPQDSDSGE